MINIKKKNCFVKTSEHWSGNYYADGTTFYDRYGMNAERPGYDVDEPATWDGEEYVELRFTEITHTHPAWSSFVRVAVWGNDDIGMFKEFTVDQAKEAEALYEELQQASDLTRELLLGKGFEYF